MPVKLALLVPSASQCLAIAGPIASLFALLWFLRHSDEFVARLFPHWEWERRLGWLNLRAQRRAEGALRWIGYLICAGLLLALACILWVSFVFGGFEQWDDPVAVGRLLLHLPLLAISLIAWVLYFTSLAPQLRADYERDELERFRLENPDPEAGEKPGAPRPVGGITVWDSPAVSPPRRR